MKVVNNDDLSVGDLTEQMRERRPLPIGRTQFEEWSQRIISGANVEASQRSLKFSLAAMLMHLGPTEAYKEDGYFILALRKAAVSQTAHAMLEEIKFEQEQEKIKREAEATADQHLKVVDGGKVLENQEV